MTVYPKPSLNLELKLKGCGFESHLSHWFFFFWWLWIFSVAIYYLFCNHYMFLCISVLKKSIPKVHRLAWVWLLSGTQMRPITLLFTNRPRPPTKLLDTFKLDCKMITLTIFLPLINHLIFNITTNISSVTLWQNTMYGYTHFVNLSFV